MASDLPALLGDVGATYARFALQDGQGITAMQSLPCEDFADLSEAMHAYLSHAGVRVVDAAIGIAAAVDDGRVRMTNRDWEFDIGQLRERMGLNRLLVFNDFAALAHALPLLAPHEARRIGGSDSTLGAPRAVVGAGTGLGAAALVPTSDGSWQALAGEGGHVSFSPLNEEEIDLWRFARLRYAHVSAERLLCGRGLELIFEWISAGCGAPFVRLAAPRITELGLRNTDARCRRSLDMFCRLLGTVAGNLALTVDARGGMYIGGGIVPRLGDFFAQSPFRQRFEHKGRLGGFLARIPVYVIHNPWAGLVGAGEMLHLQHRGRADRQHHFHSR